MSTIALAAKPFDAIDADDIKGLMGWPESLVVEYKQALSKSPSGKLDDHSRTKLFKEVVALANSAGGHLIVGIREAVSGSPVAEEITPIANIAELADTIERMAQQIDPPIPFLQIKSVNTQLDSGVLVIRVPQSSAAPHRSTDDRCYIRQGTSSVPVGMLQIRDMIMNSISRTQRFSDRLTEASRSAALWVGRPTAQPTAVLRLTAVAVGADLRLPRLTSHRDLLQIQQRFRFKSGNQTNYAVTPAIPLRMRPTVRGIRFAEDGVLRACFCDIFQDGTVNLVFKTDYSEATGESSVPRLFLGWITAYLIIVLQTAHRVRLLAGVPECEYAVEMEISNLSTSGNQIVLGWNNEDHWHVLGRIKESPMIFPLLSFASVRDLSDTVAQARLDLADAVGTEGMPDNFELI